MHYCLRIALCLALCLLTGFSDEELTVTLDGKHPELESRTKETLLGLLESYDLSGYIWTRTIRIEHDVIPHSHPVLTLSTGVADEPILLLTTFVHEQIHWFLAGKPDEAVEAAVAEFKQMYPELPEGRRMLARNEYSTYLHLIVCYLELVAMRDIAGEEAAAKAFDWLDGHHYIWIYTTVLKDEESIAAVVEKHGLGFE